MISNGWDTKCSVCNIGCNLKVTSTNCCSSCANKLRIKKVQCGICSTTILPFSRDGPCRCAQCNNIVHQSCFDVKDGKCQKCHYCSFRNCRLAAIGKCHDTISYVCVKHGKRCPHCHSCFSTDAYDKHMMLCEICQGPKCKRLLSCQLCRQKVHNVMLMCEFVKNKCMTNTVMLCCHCLTHPKSSETKYAIGTDHSLAHHRCRPCKVRFCPDKILAHCRNCARPLHTFQCGTKLCCECTWFESKGGRLLDQVVPCLFYDLYYLIIEYVISA